MYNLVTKHLEKYNPSVLTEKKFCCLVIYIMVGQRKATLNMGYQQMAQISLTLMDGLIFINSLFLEYTDYFFSTLPKIVRTSLTLPACVWQLHIHHPTIHSFHKCNKYLIFTISHLNTSSLDSRAVSPSSPTLP